MSRGLRYHFTEKWSIIDPDEHGAMLFIFDNGQKVWGTRRELSDRVDDIEFYLALGYRSSPWHRYKYEWDWATANIIINQQRRYQPNAELIQVTKRFSGWIVLVILFGILCFLALLSS